MPEPVATREVRESASEVKFLVDAETAGRIRDRARALLAPDPHAGGPQGDEYDTSTIYFDTNDFAVHDRRGSYRRAKYRIRRYGRGDYVFLERKLRTRDLLSKRRTSVSIDDLPRLTSDTPHRDWSGRWFHERLLMRRLAPVCQVAYRRTARIDMTDHGPIRLTLDQTLMSIPSSEPAFLHMEHAVPLPAESIVEMKFRATMPAVFKQIVEEFALQPQRVSKYRLGLAAARPDVAARTAAAQESNA